MLKIWKNWNSHVFIVYIGSNFTIQSECQMMYTCTCGVSCREVCSLIIVRVHPKPFAEHCFSAVIPSMVPHNFKNMLSYSLKCQRLCSHLHHGPFLLSLHLFEWHYLFGFIFHHISFWWQKVWILICSDVGFQQCILQWTERCAEDVIHEAQWWTQEAQWTSGQSLEDTREVQGKWFCFIKQPYPW